MVERNFEWKRTKEQIWDAYLCTSLGSGRLCVGYKMSEKEVAIHYNDTSVHEHVMILNGEITQTDHYTYSKDGREYFRLGLKSPEIIRDSLEMIMATIPDKKAVELLREVSIEEWAKIEPTEFEKMSEKYLYPSIQNAK